MRSTSSDSMDCSASSLMGLIQRGICVSRMQMKPDAWRVIGCDLSIFRAHDLLHQGLSDCRRVTDPFMIDAVMVSVMTMSDAPR